MNVQTCPDRYKGDMTPRILHQVSEDGMDMLVGRAIMVTEAVETEQGFKLDIGKTIDGPITVFYRYEFVEEPVRIALNGAD